MNIDVSTAYTPPTVCARMLFLAYLSAVIATVAFGTCAIAGHSWSLLAGSGGAFLLAALIRNVLLSAEEFNACVNEGEPIAAPVDLPTGAPPAAIAQLRVLLDRHNTFEEQRGTPRFDPWATLEARRKISNHVRQYPALAPLADQSQRPG